MTRQSIGEYKCNSSKLDRMKKSWEMSYQVLLVAIQRPYFMIFYDGPHKELCVFD